MNHLYTSQWTMFLILHFLSHWIQLPPPKETCLEPSLFGPFTSCLSPHLHPVLSLIALNTFIVSLIAHTTQFSQDAQQPLVHKYLLIQPSCFPDQSCPHSISLRTSRLLILLPGNHLHIPTCSAPHAWYLRFKGKVDCRLPFKYPQLILYNCSRGL